jgi:hypothetical protein
MIFEGTEGLPAQIARCLQARQLSLTLSEQFTGGLLALQLSRASAPLLASEVVLARRRRWRSPPAGPQNGGSIISPVWRWR